MRGLVVIVVALLLAGCGTTTAIKVQTNTVVVTPPETLYDCPEVDVRVNIDTLTNQQVADKIKAFYKSNKTCRINMKKIRDFVDESVKIYGVN